MPYTPPSQQSPASSKTSTPAISRNASYSHDIASLSPSHSRPSLPRSISSATYLNKHRRSPSVTSPVSTQEANMATYKFISGSKDAESVLISSSLRQSPPPLNDLVIPTGAIISPPDSSENSDGDEATTKTQRRREVEHTWNELQQAVRSMSIKRDPSPVRNTASPSRSATSEPTTSMTSPTMLSPEARKISHSRSSTETAIPHIAATCASSQTSGSDDSEDERRGGKPPLLRKKSGELVKPALRPSSRRRYSSMPGTPTYSKTVHFNDDGNQTRHFLQVDKPSAVSAGSSPVETYDSETEFPFDAKKSRIEWDIKLANFPSDENQERKYKPVWVERFFLSADNKSLVGQVAVANISFQKAVVARFTLDYWKTTSEVTADFSNDVRSPRTDGYDRFTFSIRLADQANLETKTLLLCVRYSVAGQEHWDNNADTNYQIDFVKKINSVRVTSHNISPLGARPLNAIPRSRHSPPASRGRARAPSIDDDMASQVDISSYHFGAPSAKELLVDDTQPAIKLKPRSKRAGFFPAQVPQPGQGLGGRYDFGASLSAALTNAQDKLGKQSGLLAPKMATNKNQGYFNQDVAVTPPKKEAERPEQLTTDRPAMGSAQYKDLVSKYCYFTPSATTSGKVSPLGKKTSVSSDGSADDDNNYFQSGSRSPSPTSMSPQLDGTNETGLFSPSASPYASRTASPSHITRSGHSTSRGSSPVTFGYPYHHKRDGMFSDSPAPTAIRG
ncbi:Protein phosphatase 1 regulatory subunit 3A [Sphaceloma murrayae]|uniref:Protein phosphatase 1 regulatory subunit 3A n=1 Tax=Sphaceloma murrayae TaxID=2082308 RepID=A0A2K1QJ13_9PEZI|nr:Protein phosphatase 1 regulatory subunit 3A [Sphaceloma murrayae]